METLSVKYYEGVSGGKPFQFILKLLLMLETPYHSGIITWSEDGTSIIIHNNTLFETRVLPQHFIISRMDSFTRQMNLYGFKRTSDARKQRQKEGIDKFTTFEHPNFQRDQPHLVAHIVRKKRPPTDPARKSHSRTRDEEHDQINFSDDEGVNEVVEDIYANFFPSLSPTSSTADPLACFYDCYQSRPYENFMDPQAMAYALDPQRYSEATLRRPTDSPFLPTDPLIDPSFLP